MTSREIVIVGGGIGGLTAALELRRSGYQVAVYERRSNLAEVNTGFLLWSFAVARLRSLGLGAGLDQIGEPLTRLVTKSWRGHTLSDFSLQEIVRRVGAPPCDVHRAKLQRLIADAVGSDSIHLGRRCTDVIVGQGRPVAVFEGGETASADLLLGIDGVNSVVRTKVFGEAQLHRHNVAIWRGVAEIDTGIVPPGWHIRVMGPGSLFGVGRLDDRMVRWYAGALQTDPGAGLADRDHVVDRFGGWPDPTSAVIQGTASDDLLFNDAPRARPLPAWHRGRVALLGDAAHPTLPTLAMGGGMAIEDASVFRECLTRADGPDQALQEYQGQRRRAATRVQRESLLFGGVIGLRRPFAIRAREIGFRWAAPQRKAIERLMLGGDLRARSQ